MTQAACKNETYEFHTSILRAYDIRGVVGETLSLEDAFMIGKAFATSIITASKIQNPKIAVGRDGRLSSPSLSENLAEGMKSAGANVIDIGVGPTPMLYFSVNHLNLDGGIMITGSHNPPDHNGFKMMIGKKSFFGSQITELGEIAAKGLLAEGVGSIEKVDIFDEYIEALAVALPFDESAKKMKVAWDSGNGAAGEVVAALCKKLQGEHIVFNDKIDGTFPAHHPDPTVPENLQQLIDLVKKEKCDFGVAFDGDGDRIGAVDSTGRIIFGDQLMILYSRDVLSKNEGAAIVADVKASQTLFDDISQHGGKPIMWKTGHSLIKTKMLEEKAVLGGEMSGHIFFADEYFGYDDGIYAAVRLLRLVSQADDSLDKMITNLPKVYNTPEVRIDIDEKRKFALVEEIKKRLSDAGADVNDIDGVRVNTGYGWWLIRASNTQAAVIMRCEADDEESLCKLKVQVAKQLELSGISEHCHSVT